MTIHYTVDHWVTGDGDTTTVNGSGDLCVWFHDADPTTDNPSRRAPPPPDGFTWTNDGQFTPPPKLMLDAVKPEVLDSADQKQPMTARGMQIFLEAFVGDVERVDVRDTSLV